MPVSSFLSQLAFAKVHFEKITLLMSTFLPSLLLFCYSFIYSRKHIRHANFTLLLSREIVMRHLLVFFLLNLKFSILSINNFMMCFLIFHACWNKRGGRGVCFSSLLHFCNSLILALKTLPLLSDYQRIWYLKINLITCVFLKVFEAQEK